MIWKILFFGLLFIWALIDLNAGQRSKTIVANRCNESPVIDGRLDENSWNYAVPVSGFLQYDPNEGDKATEQTSVRVLYDDGALYFGVICYDSDPSGIVHQLTRRDRSVEADKFTIMIDSYHDHQTAFVFSGSVSGVQSDGVLSNDGRVYDVQWDAVWNYSASIIPEGWSAEFEIPFNALRFSAQGDEYVWGINFRRYIARKKEVDEWVLVRRSEIPPGTISSVSLMGHLSGIRDIKPPLNLVIMPYAVAQLNSISQPNPFKRRNWISYPLGFDLKYSISNNFTFDAAINPDFGQVEVDEAVLNLTVFETYYPEKRPFFLEAAPIFTFGNMVDNRPLALFYSRRIGKPPEEPTPDSGYVFIDKQKQTTILGAGKFTGRTDGGLSVGVITALTDAEYGIQENASGQKLPKQLLEPRASYNVLRLKQDFSVYNSVGFMATGVFKDSSKRKVSGGFDWNIRFGNGQYALDGYIAGSQAVVPYKSKDLSTGSAGRIGFAKIEGKHWLFFSFYNFSTKNFYIDDLGYYSQPREHGGYTQISYKEDFASTPLRRYAFSFQTDYKWNWDNVKTLSNIEFESVKELENFWMIKFNYYHYFPSYDDEYKLTYMGKGGKVLLYRKPLSDRFAIMLQTDTRYWMSSLLQVGYQNTSKNMQSFDALLQPTFRPTTWLDISPTFYFARVRREESWIIGNITGDGYNMFCDRDVDQYDFSLRGTIMLTRSLSTQFFTQVLLIKGRCLNFKELVEPNLFRSVDLSGVDFFQNTVNANFVVRWEYLPGSTLFLVWTQSRVGDSGSYKYSIYRDIKEAFKLPMDNVFLLKVSYWWSH